MAPLPRYFWNVLSLGSNTGFDFVTCLHVFTWLAILSAIVRHAALRAPPPLIKRMVMTTRDRAVTLTVT